MAGSRPRDEAARRTALAPGVSRLRLERNRKRSEVCLHQGKNSRNSPSALSNSTFLWKTTVFPNKKNTQRAVAVPASLIQLPPSCPWRPAPCAGRERGPGHGCPAAARLAGPREHRRTVGAVGSCAQDTRPPAAGLCSEVCRHRRSPSVLLGRPALAAQAPGVGQAGHRAQCRTRGCRPVGPPPSLRGPRVPGLAL